MPEEKKAGEAPYIMSPESVAAYIRWEESRGMTQTAIRNYKRFAESLFTWLPEDKLLTKERLLDWRRSLQDHGYSAQTQMNYAKGINRYLDYMGFCDIRFTRGRAKDLKGKQFGYLTAIEPIGTNDRKEILWRCRCQCGKEAEYPATRLLLGNTLSCGCLRSAHLEKANQYIDGTSLRQSLREQVYSDRAASGYTGVAAKGEKWQAQIGYKGQRISLGCYTDLEDAVKARARGKESVQLDAMGLLECYRQFHRDDPPLPDREQIRAENRPPRQEATGPAMLPAIRSNNTSGHPGVYRKRDKWIAKITYQKITYHLGVYADLPEALAARQEAQTRLADDPAHFLLWIRGRKEHTVY